MGYFLTSIHPSPIPQPSVFCFQITTHGGKKPSQRRNSNPASLLHPCGRGNDTTSDA